MQCPVDNTTLVMADRSGVEIDHCPQCRGVWLDRGELDKIIERSTTQYRPSQDMKDYDDRGRSSHGDSHKGGSHGRRNERRGWLGELFD